MMDKMLSPTILLAKIMAPHSPNSNQYSGALGLTKRKVQLRVSFSKTQDGEKEANFDNIKEKTRFLQIDLICYSGLEKD